VSSVEKSTVEEILERHGTLLGLLGSLRDAEELASVVELLSMLLVFLPTHFAHEEGPEGLVPLIRTRAPGREREVRALLDEHASILTDVSALLAQARSCGEGSVASIQAEIQSAVRRLLSHEERESELISDVLYTDIGGSD